MNCSLMSFGKKGHLKHTEWPYILYRKDLFLFIVFSLSKKGKRKEKGIWKREEKGIRKRKEKRKRKRKNKRKWKSKRRRKKRGKEKHFADFQLLTKPPEITTNEMMTSILKLQIIMQNSQFWHHVYMMI